jgi:tetracycline repressor-like protein
MARTLDPVAHAVRREAFLDAGQRLIATKGYTQLSIQDVLDELASSKGAFYHYFDSRRWPTRAAPRSRSSTPSSPGWPASRPTAGS